MPATTNRMKIEKDSGNRPKQRQRQHKTHPRICHLQTKLVDLKRNTKPLEEEARNLQSGTGKVKSWRDLESEKQQQMPRETPTQKSRGRNPVSDSKKTG